MFLPGECIDTFCSEMADGNNYVEISRRRLCFVYVCFSFIKKIRLSLMIYVCINFFLLKLIYCVITNSTPKRNLVFSLKIAEELLLFRLVSFKL